jgi:hypothetical protein
MASEENSTSADEKRLADWNTSSNRPVSSPCRPASNAGSESVTGTPRAPLTLGRF